MVYRVCRFKSLQDARERINIPTTSAFLGRESTFSREDISQTLTLVRKAYLIRKKGYGYRN